MKTHKKKPFSGKKKKEQLKNKKERKRAQNDNTDVEKEILTAARTTTLVRNPRNKLTTVFREETKEELRKRAESTRKPLDPVSDCMSELSLLGVGRVPIPTRPPWYYGMSKEQLESNEKLFFEKYLNHLNTKYGPERLNHFEHNLEVWRQLWRTMEISDVLLIVTDIRYPLFHFPHSLYTHITEKLQKPFIVVFNKVDLVTKAVLEAWEDYFHEHYPLTKIVRFTSNPTATVTAKSEFKTVKFYRRKKKMRLDYHHTFGTETVMSVLNEFAEEMVTSPSHVTATRIGVVSSRLTPDESSTHPTPSFSPEEAKELEGKEEEEEVVAEFIDDAWSGLAPGEKGPAKRAKTYITVGLIGHPNVGKSTLINALMRKKVVSVSQTPGHTKHFQTLFLSEKVRLCDCPGLVFPAVDIPIALQVACGVLPIANLREPYTAVEYIAARTPLIASLRLTAVDRAPDDPEEQARLAHEPWSAWGLCEAYAHRRGYYTQRSGRPDVYRAANEILRHVVAGTSVVLSIKPLGFVGEGSDSLATSALANEEEEEEEDGEEEEEEEEEGTGESDFEGEGDGFHSEGCFLSVKTSVEKQIEKAEEDDKEEEEEERRPCAANPFALLHGSESEEEEEEEEED